MRKLMITLVVVLAMLCSTVSAFALGPDPDVLLVNPGSNAIVCSNNLLISVKISQPKTIRVQVFAQKQMVNGTLSAVSIDTMSISNGAVSKKESLIPVPIMDAATFQSKNNLSFYTKQINVSPGVYKIRIETLDASNKPIYCRENYVAIKEKTEDQAKILDTPQSGTMQFLQNLLKTIFGN